MPASAHKPSKFLMVLRLIFFHVPIAVGCLVLAHRLTSLLLYQWAVAHDQLHSRPQSYTRQMLTLLAQDIKTYQQQHGTLPETLTAADVPGFVNSNTANKRLPYGTNNFPDPVDAQGRPLDYWNRPFQYVVNDSEVELFSLGQDGLSGGLGMDADLYADGRTDAIAVPTLKQFLSKSQYEFHEGPGIIAFPNLMSVFAPTAYFMGLWKAVDFALLWILRRFRRRSPSTSADSAGMTEAAP